jgi:fibro-slime domain-containing protein
MLQKMILCMSLITIGSLSVFSQKYPDIIRVPVTFYDFHSDRSNPEFEQPHYSGIKTGMVHSTLGTDGKPVLGSSPYRNYGLKNWFTPWSPGDYQTPTYTPLAPAPPFRYEGGEWVKEFQQQISYDGMKTVSYDTAFKNIVIQDSLRFVHVGNGTYEFIDETFFPLDNRGFGNEWTHERGNTHYNQQQGIDPNHNYSFTMELHWTFVKKQGLQFKFSGDDDVWVFVNKKLMIDLGGIHDGKQERSFQLGKELIDGKPYDLDIFYAERHSSGSHIRISTNIIFASSTIGLYTKRGTPDSGSNTHFGIRDSVKAGQPFTIYGNIFDSTGTWKPEHNQYITWELADKSSNPGLTTTRGDSTTFFGTVVGSQVTITARYKDPNDHFGRESVKNITLTVTKGPPPPPYAILFFDRDGDPSLLTPVASMSTTAGQEVSIYAHLFDTSNTWLPNYDRFIKWSVKETTTNTTLYPTVGNHTTVVPKTAGTVTIIAEFSDPDNLARPKSHGELPISVKADVENKVDILSDSSTTKSGQRELILGPYDDFVPLFGVVRDRYDNFIRYTNEFSHWVSTNAPVIDISQPSGPTTNLVKRDLSLGDECTIILTEGVLVPDTLFVGIRGAKSIIATPVPFIPGYSNLISTIGQKKYDYYTNVHNNQSNVLLVAVGTEGALLPLVPSDSTNPKTSYAKVRIYDAVGNLIRTDIPLIKAGNSRSYGIVWNALNNNNRVVGAGTYLVDIRARERKPDNSIGNFVIRSKVAIGTAP